MRKIVFSLIACLSIVQVLVMSFIVTSSVYQQSAWLAALLDAGIMAGVAIIVVSLLVRCNLKQQASLSCEWLILRTGGIVFTLEVMIMLLISALSLALSDWQKVTIDVVVIGVIAPLLIRNFALQPDAEERFQGSPLSKSVDTFLGYLSVMTVIALLMLASYEQQYRKLEQESTAKEAHTLELLASAIHNHFSYAILDLLTLVRHAEHARPWSDSDALQVMKRHYQYLQDIKNFYYQVRFLDHQGNELVRVNRTEGRSLIIPDDQLQNKKHRYYFQMGKQLSPGHIYLSSLDLNMEYGQISQPLQPVIRVVSPVFAADGEFRGVVVLNMNAEIFLSDFSGMDQDTQGELMLLNKDSFWLYGGKESERWAFMFPDPLRASLKARQPELWQKMSEHRQGVIRTEKYLYIYKSFEHHTDSEQAHKVEWSHTTHQLKNWPEWKIISRLPVQSISSQLTDFVWLMLGLYLLLAILLGIAVIMVFRADKRRRKAEQAMFCQAMLDNLTGLANRRQFTDILERELAKVQRHQQKIALMYMDLDKFKPVNDRLGHQAGDLALQQVAQRLGHCFRKTDTLARLGGDEFAAILPEPGEKRDLEAMARRILDEISSPFLLDGQSCDLGITIGICMASESGESMKTLIHRADTALYKGKEAGRNCYRFG